MQVVFDERNWTCNLLCRQGLVHLPAAVVGSPHPSLLCHCRRSQHPWGRGELLAMGGVVVVVFFFGGGGILYINSIFNFWMQFCWFVYLQQQIVQVCCFGGFLFSNGGGMGFQYIFIKLWRPVGGGEGEQASKKSKACDDFQDTNDEYWVSGRTEEEAKKKAAEKFKVAEDKISLRQGMNARACWRVSDEVLLCGSHLINWKYWLIFAN